MSATQTSLAPASVSVRVKISGLWVSMLFVFAYVDLFSLYRPDFRAEVESGKVGGFDVGQGFLLSTTVYVAVPSLMVFLALVLRPQLDRVVNIVVAVGYVLTIVAASVGEANYYYLLGSVIEVALLAGVVFFAWSWPREPAPPA